MEYKEIAIWLAFTLEAIIIYIFNSNKKEVEREFQRLESKIHKIESGEFVEKTVRNVMYSPEGRAYFKSVVTEALNHHNKNEDLIKIEILKYLEKIETKLNK
jgi:hypothetical protein